MALSDYINETRHLREGEIQTCLLILKDGRGTIVGQVPITEDETNDKDKALKQAQDSATGYLKSAHGIDVNATNPANATATPKVEKTPPKTEPWRK